MPRFHMDKSQNTPTIVVEAWRENPATGRWEVEYDLLNPPIEHQEEPSLTDESYGRTV